ncbi:LysM peptidoglycan-binding domain-containing protein [Salipiger mangrovisoli]|uniref:LysM peptidoglycan-binding domain-containing protein n=1 Tax=Salipiger mangrovisoli TaxID=2865933 RepID=A0ABR9WWD3_9RHOB|nr:LysM peptidoglycan-binding domain-containing protein [Salipiger mangrovisoli]MBE9635567.1 LysM peptidoglycan-binding domain-containing protein [Salipiger mangrovisoli]
MNDKLWVWIGLGAAAVVGALYVSGVIGPNPTEMSQPAVTQVTETPGKAAAPSEARPAQSAETQPDAPQVADTNAENAAEAAADAGTGAAPETPETDAPATDAQEPGSEVALALPSEGEAATETSMPPAETDATPPVADAPEAAGAAAPSFDLVRAEPGGLITVAGRAVPGSEVVLLLDGEAELTSPVGDDGRFAAFFDLPPSSVPQVLRLRMSVNGQQVDSEQEVILTPPVPQVASAAPEGEATEAATGLSAAGTTEGQSPEPAAPTVLLSDARGVEVMQSPQPVAPGGVAIDAITYDDEGGVELSGRGSGEAVLRVYLDNSEVTTLQVASNGRWQVALPQIAAGTYTLRVDQIDAGGKVMARAESPFRREPPEKLAAAAAELTSAEAVTAVTVQPGNTLWAIARERYGDGMSYVRLFEANKTQIRDPNLIYPGQIFAFPD